MNAIRLSFRIRKNKSNGQMNISLPKKKLPKELLAKKFLEAEIKW